MAADLSPCTWAARPLFGPLARWLGRFDSLPDLAALNRLAVEAALTGGGGQSLRFVADAQPAMTYEVQIFERGEIPTRAGNLHDFFNALCWLAFPRAKAALNARHMAHLQPGQRGAMRDAATQFDECGLIVLHANPQLAALLAEHAWHQAFWQSRQVMQATMRFVVFGHALYERLPAPWPGLCGKAVHLEAEQDLIDAPVEHQCAFIDAQLAARFSSDDFCTTPQSLHALPVMGIPGVTPDNEQASYYFDTRQFRPRRGPGAPAAR